MADGGPGKDRFTSLDTLALVHELRALGRARIDKAYDDPGSGGWILSLRSSTAGRRELRVVPGRYAALLPRGEGHLEEPGPFARELRRLLSGATIASIAEPGGERYLEIELRRGDVDEPLRLAVELFGRGNVVVARGERIAAVAYPRTWAHRTVRVGAEYRAPPARGNPWTLGAAELASAFLASRTDRVTTLAARLAFGGSLAEELLARAGLPPNEPARSSATEAAQAIAPRLVELLVEVGERPVGYLYRRGDALMDVEPYRARRFELGSAPVEVEQFPAFSEAAERFFREVRPDAAPPSPEELRRRELRRQRDQQEEAIRALEGEVARRRGEADALLAQYARAEALLRAPADEAPGAESVLLHLEGVDVELRTGENPRTGAQRLYAEMKQAQAKLAGARAALAESARALEQPTTTPRSRTERAPPRRKFWFEAYRWFLSSEGLLVLGGRDAGSNDRIVKRYLGEHDLYVHADLHGAPSVVVRRAPSAGEEVPAPTLREAAQWGLSFSKAWRAGRASGDAFWVRADQVTKAGATGEFVARGAWVIHGTKQQLRDLPLELGLGTVVYEGVELWTVAPPESFVAPGRLRVRLAPGEERDRAEVERALADEVGLGRSELQRLLPSGGVRYLRA